MSSPGAPYYQPFEEGPLFPDDSVTLVRDTETFLRASGRNATDEVAQRNIADLADDSFRLWVMSNLPELDLDPNEQ